MNVITKKLLYECFVRCHLLYCLTVWGSTHQSKLKPLINILKKSWRHISPKKQHTITRLKNNNILKLEDELTVQESKFVWRWEKGKLPNSLKQLIIEKNDNLRGRPFIIPRGALTSSIISCINKRAETSISTITLAKTKKSMTTKLKKSIMTTYSFVCS